MDYILNFFNFIQSLGVAVFMPIIIFIMGLIFRLGVSKSIKAGLTVGIGFIGLNLIINNLLGTSLSPAVQAMIEKYGFNLSTIDVGWPATAAIALGSKVGVLIIPIGVVVNILMLLTNTTQTVDVDIWDYWHFAFTGTLVAILTDNLWFGIATAAINMIIIMVLADVTAGEVEKSLGIPGVSLPHGFTTAYAPIAIVFNKIIDKIPVINKIDINFEKMQSKLGILGEPIIVGTVIGLILGVVAGYDVAGVLTLAISLGAVLILIPKMAAMLMEGLEPISEAAGKFIQSKFKHRGKMYIGLDSAIGVGHPITLTVAYILMPLSILLAVILPGNTVMPFADLAVLPWMFVLITPIVRNNGFRALLIGIVCLVSGLYISTNLAPLFTEAAKNVGFDMPTGATLISSICDGANPMTWILVRINEFGYIGLGISALVAVLLALWNRKRIMKEAEFLHD